MKYWPVPNSQRIIPKSKSGKGFAANRQGKRFHAGVDIVAPFNSKVVAIEFGVVANVFLFTYPSLDNYVSYRNSWAVVIKHLDGNYALYGELQKPNIVIGQLIKAGQVIGRVGRVVAGDLKRAMLHFEYHCLLPKKTTKWYFRKKPKGLLNSAKYLRSIWL